MKRWYVVHKSIQHSPLTWKVARQLLPPTLMIQSSTCHRCCHHHYNYYHLVRSAHRPVEQLKHHSCANKLLKTMMIVWWVWLEEKMHHLVRAVINFVRARLLGRMCWISLLLCYLLRPMNSLPPLSLWYMHSSSSSLKKSSVQSEPSDVKSGKCEKCESSRRGFDLTQE